MTKREIMVIPRSKLFAEAYFENFSAHSNHNYESIILGNHQYLDRELAETNPDYKQPIAYVMIINPIIGKVLAYQRSKKDKDYKEKRLQGKLSIGIGGHIDKHHESSADNPILASLKRELKEEVIIHGRFKQPVLLGYINDDSDDVGKVHFGMLYYIETDATEITPRDSEIGLSSFLSKEEILAMSDNIQLEGWTRIAIEYVPEILTKINQP